MLKDKTIIILSTLLVILFGFLFGDTVYDGTEGWKSAMYDQKSKNAEDKTRVGLTLRPIQKYNFPDTLTTAQGTDVPYQITEVYVQSNSFMKNNATIILSVLLAFIILVAGGIYAIISFVKFIRDVQFQRIFTRKNVRRLYILSGMTLYLGILDNAILVLDYYGFLAHNSINFPGYEISKYELHYSLFFIAVFFALFARIFSIGVKMKEEQDLTV